MRPSKSAPRVNEEGGHLSNQTVFVSYVADDAVDAHSLMNDLARAGVAIADRAMLLKPGNLRAQGAVWDAINATSHFVLCLSSRDGLPPKYAEDEVQAAISAKRPIIPVRLTRCDIPKVQTDDEHTIADREPVDFYADRDASVERLLTALPRSAPQNPIARPRRTIVRVDGDVENRKGLKTDADEVSFIVGGNMKNDGPTEL